MIRLNNIELSDTEYRVKLNETLDYLLKKFEEVEDYEICKSCLDMKKLIPSQPIEKIKDSLTTFSILISIINTK